MFNRFTLEAHRVVEQARDQSVALRHPQIGTEHLLLGLLFNTGPVGYGLSRDGLETARVVELLGECVHDRPESDSDLLRGLGIDLDQIRENVEEQFGLGALDRAPDRGHTHVA